MNPGYNLPLDLERTNFYLGVVSGTEGDAVWH